MTDVFTAVEGKQKYMKMLGGRPSEVVESENKKGKEKKQSYARPRKIFTIKISHFKSFITAV